LRSIHDWNKYGLEFLRIIPQLARIPQVDGVTLSSFDGAGDAFSSDSRLDQHSNVTHHEPITSYGIAANVDIQVITACHSLGENRSRTGDGLENPFQLFPDLFDLF